MSGTPKEIEARIRRIINAWEEMASNKTFGALTLDQYKAGTLPSFTVRDHLLDLADQTAQAIVTRENNDETSLGLSDQVVNGVRADPSEGPDSALYERMGYTRKSERKSGLSRKKSTPPKP
jgi:hypothetical protein